MATHVYADVFRTPLTPALIAGAGLMSQRDCEWPTTLTRLDSVPPDEVWTLITGRVASLWVAPGTQLTGVTPAQIVAVIARQRRITLTAADAPQSIDLQSELLALRAALVRIDETSTDCPMCRYRPCVATCGMRRIRAGLWLTVEPNTD